MLHNYLEFHIFAEPEDLRDTAAEAFWNDMELNGTYFVYGMSTMFYAMMTYFFVRKGDRLSKLVALLTCTIGIQCLLFNFFMLKESYANGYWWDVQASTDMIAVPMYAFILIELVKPGKLRKRNMILHEIPFVLFPMLFIATANQVFYYILVGWAGLYGNFMLIWTLIQIPRYHRVLKEHFSYTENVDLRWLRTILISFYVILGLWIISCIAIRTDIEALYMLLSTAIWMAICYYLYRHEQVLDELRSESEQTATEAEPVLSELGVRIEHQFREKQIFLNPQLKVSDIARACNTNRTYVSNYFNQEAGVTFYEYVNALRVDYACTLLQSSTDSIKIIAERSGFNSQQSFIRTFLKIKGISPTEFRNL